MTTMIPALDTTTTLAAADRREPSAAGFDAALDRASDARDMDEAAGRLRTAIGQLVADAFVKPILARAQDDPLATDMFHGGPGEDAFRGRLNEALADRIVGRMSAPGQRGVVQAIFDQYWGQVARRNGWHDAATGREVDRHG